MPTSRNKLLAEWKGPFNVLEKVSPVDYRIQMNTRKMSVFYINMLKPYFERHNPEEERYEAIQCLDIICSIEDTFDDPIQEVVNPYVLIVFCLFIILFISPFGFKSGILISIAPVPVRCFSNNLNTFAEMYTDVPGKTNLITRADKLKEENPIFKNPYFLPFALR